MQIPTIKELVIGNYNVTFQYYTCGNLWYKHDNGFLFPVPISAAETGDGVFNNVEDARLFMRWMRKHIEFLNNAVKEIYDASK